MLNYNLKLSVHAYVDRTEMLKSINSCTIMIILILFSVSILGYLHEAKAQYTGVNDVGSGTGIITCPTGEQHEGPIAFEGFSSPSLEEPLIFQHPFPHLQVKYLSRVLLIMSR